MMKIIVLLLGTIISCIGWSATMAKEYYTTAFDTVDVDAILANKRLTDQYIACLLDAGPCTSDGRGLRRILPDAIATYCDKCSDVQKMTSKKVLRYLREMRSDVWPLFVEKYDPEGEYIVNFEKYLNEELNEPEDQVDYE